MEKKNMLEEKKSLKKNCKLLLERKKRKEKREREEKEKYKERI